MRPLIIALTATLFIGSCACDCNAQWRRGGNYYTPAPQYQYPPTYRPAFDPNRKVDGAGGYNYGRMAELPQGAERLQLWVVLSPQFRSSPLETKVAAWFTGGQPNERNQPRSADPRLRQMQDQSAFNYYYSTNPLFAQSGLIQAVGSATPIVCLTKPDGAVVANLGPAELAPIANAGSLADLLNNGIEHANPPRKFEGQSLQSGGIITETGSQCGPDGCPPQQQPTQTPVVQPAIPRVVPSRLNAAGIAVAGVALAIGVALIVGGITLGLTTPGVRRT